MGTKSIKAMNRADKILLVSIAGLILITAVVFFISSKNSSDVTLRVVQENDERTKAAGQYELSCSDNDGGPVYTVVGSVNYCNENGECFKEDDSCSGNVLKEMYCSGGEPTYENKGCEGECDAGKCINLVTDKKVIYGSSGGGGGGGSSGSSGGGTSTSIVKESGQNYDAGSNLLEKNVELASGDSVSFSINNQAYTLDLNELGATQAGLSVNGISRTIDVGGELFIDLNSDGDNDLWIRLKSISIVTNKAKLILNEV